MIYVHVQLLKVMLEIEIKIIFAEGITYRIEQWKWNRNDINIAFWKLESTIKSQDKRRRLNIMETSQYWMGLLDETSTPRNVRLRNIRIALIFNNFLTIFPSPRAFFQFTCDIRILLELH